MPKVASTNNKKELEASLHDQTDQQLDGISEDKFENESEPLVMRYNHLSTDELLEQLEKLKTDKVKTHVNYDNYIISDDDDSRALDIRQKMTELMAVNSTLQSLSFRWMYSHKRQYRELKVHTENQQIKIRLINGNNTQYPGEFYIPGFDEVSGLDTDDKGEAILVKDVAVYDRSKLVNQVTAPMISIFGAARSSSATDQHAVAEGSIASRVVARHSF